MSEGWNAPQLGGNMRDVFLILIVFIVLFMAVLNKYSFSLVDHTHATEPTQAALITTQELVELMEKCEAR